MHALECWHSHSRFVCKKKACPTPAKKDLYATAPNTNYQSLALVATAPKHYLHQLILILQVEDLVNFGQMRVRTKKRIGGGGARAICALLSILLTSGLPIPQKRSLLRDASREHPQEEGALTQPPCKWLLEILSVCLPHSPNHHPQVVLCGRFVCNYQNPHPLTNGECAGDN